MTSTIAPPNENSKSCLTSASFVWKYTVALCAPSSQAPAHAKRPKFYAQVLCMQQWCSPSLCQPGLLSIRKLVLVTKPRCPPKMLSPRYELMGLPPSGAIQVVAKRQLSQSRKLVQHRHAQSQSQQPPIQIQKGCPVSAIIASFFSDPTCSK